MIVAYFVTDIEIVKSAGKLFVKALVIFAVGTVYFSDVFSQIIKAAETAVVYPFEIYPVNVLPFNRIRRQIPCVVIIVVINGEPDNVALFYCRF